MHCANDGEEGAGIHQPEPGARKQTRRRQHFGSAVPASLVKFQVNEQETELELEVGPENDHGQAEKWKANVVVVGGGGGVVAAAGLTMREYRTSRVAGSRLKIK